MNCIILLPKLFQLYSLDLEAFFVKIHRCKLTCMMATGKTLVPLRLSIMQTWESPKSLCQTSGTKRLCNIIIIFSMYCFESMLVMNHDVYMFSFGVGDNGCSFYDRSSPIYTQPRYLPPSKMLDADITDSVIGEGCVIKVTSSRSVLRM